MSCTPVSPTLAVAASARLSASLRIASSAGGTAAFTKSVAASMKTPVGRPPSRRMRPPCGCQSPPRSRLTRRIAVEFAQPAWPSMRSSHTGRLGKAASRSAAVGNALSGQSFWSQPWPSSQASGGSFAANACSRSMSSRLLDVPTRSALISAKPRPIRCACASMSPGTTVAPCASCSGTPGACAITSARRPTATMRPSRPHASASALGCDASRVWMCALTSTPASPCDGAAPNSVSAARTKCAAGLEYCKIAGL